MEMDQFFKNTNSWDSPGGPVAKTVTPPSQFRGQGSIPGWGMDWLDLLAVQGTLKSLHMPQLRPGSAKQDQTHELPRLTQYKINTLDSSITIKESELMI